MASAVGGPRAASPVSVAQTPGTNYGGYTASHNENSGFQNYNMRMFDPSPSPAGFFAQNGQPGHAQAGGSSASNSVAVKAEGDNMWPPQYQNQNLPQLRMAGGAGPPGSMPSMPPTDFSMPPGSSQKQHPTQSQYQQSYYALPSPKS